MSNLDYTPAPRVLVIDHTHSAANHLAAWLKDSVYTAQPVTLIGPPVMAALHALIEAADTPDVAAECYRLEATLSAEMAQLFKAPVTIPLDEADDDGDYETALCSDRGHVVLEHLLGHSAPTPEQLAILVEVASCPDVTDRQQRRDWALRTILLSGLHDSIHGSAYHSHPSYDELNQVPF